jgi:cellulose synthase/poly-beta-1,6-N-acetylglucosamine synthase-like glycosyltransferase
MPPIITPVSGVILGVSTLLSFAFIVYGFNMLHLTRRAMKYHSPLEMQLERKPAVAVHLPIYDELYVVGRVLEACVKMAEHYGRDLVRICVIDDSDDETSVEVDKAVDSYRRQGYRVEALRRGTREGFKAGALQAALEQTTEPYVAIFDADFVPPADFLDRTAPFLESNEHVGFVQARWVHLDRGYNTITESLAIGVDTHFLLEQAGRWSSGYLMNFNGSAGLIRRQAIIKAGGWSKETLAEDLDLSYRMQLAGYRAVYLEDVEVPAELPPTITGFKRQQGRWARGSLQTAKGVIPGVLSSHSLSIKQKFEAVVHLTYYLVHPLMVLSFLLALIATFLDVDVIKYTVNLTLPQVSSGPQAANAGIEIAPWVVFSGLIVASTLAVLYSCMVAVRVQKLGLLRNIKEILLLVIIGYGISISNSVSALAGLFSKKTGNFQRTPKYAIKGKEDSWRGKKYQLSINGVTALEALATAVGMVAIYWGYETGNAGIIPILAVYVTGYLFVLALTVSHSFRTLQGPG